MLRRDRVASAARVPLGTASAGSCAKARGGRQVAGGVGGKQLLCKASGLIALAATAVTGAGAGRQVDPPGVFMVSSR